MTPAQEGDVGAGAYRRIKIRYRGGAREARIHHDQLGIAIGLGLGHPLEAAGVCLGGIAAHDQNQIGILDVDPMIGHRTAAERRGKTCHRRSVSDACLIIECEHPQAARHLLREVACFVAGSGSGQETGGQPAVHRGAVLVLGDEILVAVFLHQLGDAGKGIVPGDARPFLAAGGAVLRDI